MEDTLEIFQGFLKIGKWSNRYCILRDNILIVCSQKEGEIEGKIHLKIAIIQELKPTQTEFKINTGSTQMSFRTQSLAAKSKWINAL